MALKKIALIGTGGTISAVSALGPLDLVDYTAQGRIMTAGELLDHFPAVRSVAEIVPVPFRAVVSTSIGFEDWKSLVATMEETLARHPDLAGMVITHGTATLEETAFALHLTSKVQVPVVLTGAQRPASALASDAGLNLLNAVRTAACPEARGMGVLVCLNDEIQSAREVTKTSTARLQTFRTPDFGVLGHVDGDAVQFYRRPMRRRAPDTEFDLRALPALPRVDVAYAYAGDDGTAVRAFTAAGAQAIVYGAFPAGLLSPEQLRACDEALAAGVLVAISTRAGSGRALPNATLRSRGMIAADNLNPQKARILLALALTVTRDRGDIERIFATY